MLYYQIKLSIYEKNVYKNKNKNVLSNHANKLHIFINI